MMKLCKKQKILASRLQRPGMTSSLKNCFKTVADGPKTGLLAARAISTWRIFWAFEQLSSTINWRVMELQSGGKIVQKHMLNA